MRDTIRNHVNGAMPDSLFDELEGEIVKLIEQNHVVAFANTPVAALCALLLSRQAASAPKARLRPMMASSPARGLGDGGARAGGNPGDTEISVSESDDKVASA